MENNDKELRKTYDTSKGKTETTEQAERGLETRSAVGRYELLFQTKSDRLTSQNPASEDGWY